MTRELWRLDDKDLTARMLDAAKADSPSDQAIDGALRALGVPAAAIATAQVAGAAKAWWSSYLGYGGLVVVGVVVAGAAWLAWPSHAPLSGGAGPADAAVASASSSTEVLAPPVASSAEAPAAEPPATALQPVQAPKPSMGPGQVGPAPSASTAGLRGQDRLIAEVRALDEVRGAIRSGAPDRALSLLDAYGQAFPKPVMGSEAQVLRIEALAKAGRAAEAQALAEAFLRAAPDGPLSARVRRLVGLAPGP